jgi:hypothetical protein
MPDQTDRLNRDALIELVRNAMASGAMVFIEKATRGEVDPSAALGDAFGDFPQEFIGMRSDLIDALTEE